MEAHARVLQTTKRQQPQREETNAPSAHSRTHTHTHTHAKRNARTHAHTQVTTHLDRPPVGAVRDGVRVAHRDARHRPRPAGDAQLLLHDGVGSVISARRRERRRHAQTVEDGLAHVDAHLAVGQQLRLDEAFFGFLVFLCVWLLCVV